MNQANDGRHCDISRGPAQIRLYVRPCFPQFRSVACGWKTTGHLAAPWFRGQDQYRGSSTDWGQGDPSRLVSSRRLHGSMVQLLRSRSPARRRRQKGGDEDRRVGRSRRLTTKIHALVDAEGGRSTSCSPPGRPATRRPGVSCWRGSHQAASCSPTGPMTPTPSAPTRRSAADLPMCRLARSESAPRLQSVALSPEELRRALL